MVKFLKIEVFEKNTKAVTIKLPLALIKLTLKVIPTKYLSSIEEQYPSIEDIVDALNDTPEALIDIEDNGGDQRVVISIE